MPSNNRVVKQPADVVHDHRRPDREIDETSLEAQARLLRKRLELVTSSPGWKLVCWYRLWLRRTIWPRPILKRAYERAAQWILRRALGAESAGRLSETTNASRMPGAVNESVLHQVLVGDQIIARFDEVSPNSPFEVRGRTEIYGWAVARSGSRDLRARVDEGPSFDVETGLFRPDIETLLPEYEGSGRSGFRIRLNGVDYSAGVHDLNVETRALDGDSMLLTRRFLCDSREPYQVWISENESAAPEAGSPDSGPTISVILPLTSEPLSSVRPGIDSITGQRAAKWELLLGLSPDRAPELAEVAQGVAAAETQVQVVPASQLLERCTGDYVACVEPGCLLPRFALTEVVAALARNESTDVLYSDEDSIHEEGRRCDPVFEPEYSPDLIRSCNYIGGLLVARRSTIEAAGGLGASFDRARNYDLILRLTERTSKIVRIPKVLYHRQPGARELSPEASADAMRALEAHLERSGEDAAVDQVKEGVYRVRYLLPEPPPVAVIMPTAGNIPRLRDSLDAILQATYHGRLRVLVADNSKSAAVETFIAGLNSQGRVQRLDYRNRPFNFSAISNAAARTEDSPLYLFLNDDVEALNPDWLMPLVEHAARPAVGVVGGRLRFPDLTIQHSGVIMGVNGVLGTPFYRQRGGAGHVLDLSAVTRNCAAVTGACLLTRRDVFWELGGFDEARLQISYQDIDYCLRAQEAGYRVVYTPHAELLHHESVSRVRAGLLEHPSEHSYMCQRWARWIEDDPYYSPNLSRDQENLEIRFGAKSMSPKRK